MSDRPILSAVRKNGDPLKVSVSLSNVVLDGVNYSAAVISNAQMIATSEANILRELAEKDALTGLVNRVFLSKTIQNHMDENGVFTMLFLDLNKFKPINDEFGHGMGDHILIQVAKRLCGHIRTGDCVARIGGDEFVLLIKNLDQCSRIRSLCEEIAHSISMPITCSGNTLNVGVSIGAAIFPIHGNDEKSILKAADTAMYQAKNTQQPYAIYSLDEAMTDG
ncbi:MAG: GGDEF domain-containing protein [Methylococcales bacterium]|nr:GGDEF domain-containing protein [Methylococcales bacterium]